MYLLTNMGSTEDRLKIPCVITGFLSQSFLACVLSAHAKELNYGNKAILGPVFTQKRKYILKMYTSNHWLQKTYQLPYLQFSIR